jgi:hypothetical protein
MHSLGEFEGIGGIEFVQEVMAQFRSTMLHVLYMQRKVGSGTVH